MSVRGVCDRLDEKALSPVARLLYGNAERISLSANDIEYDHPQASQDRLACVMLLDALLTSPDAVIHGLRYVCDDMVKAVLAARRSAATEPGLAADGALRPQDRAFLKSEFGSKVFPIYECAAAKAQAEGGLVGVPDPEKSKRVTDALLKLQKTIVAGLQQAYDG